MSATDARPVARKNAAFRFYFAIRKNDGTLITSWAGQDSEVSIDGGAFADCTNEATEIGTSGCGYIDLTSSEMNGDSVMLKINVTNTDAIPLVVVFFPEEAGDYRAAVSDKTGFKLASDGLDSISTTAPTGVASNFREMLVQVWRRFFKRVTKDSDEIKTYADDGTTVATTQTYTSSGTDDDVGAAT